MGSAELRLRALLATAYTFGFRKGELLDLRVRQVNLIDRTITLDPGTTKNEEGREVVMTNDVFLLLQACCAGKSADGFVFTRSHERVINDFRGSWGFLCAAAGLGKMLCPKCSGDVMLDADGKCAKCLKRSAHPKCVGLLFHDLRRSAVRNMVRRGIPERVAMQISGHKTRTVFDRYNIVSQTDLIEAARKIEHGQSQNFGHSLGIVESRNRHRHPLPTEDDHC